jgi:hypothetical protein
MKLFKSFAFCGMLALGPLGQAATSLETLHARVPFAFMLAGHELSAGDYEIQENSDGTILVSGNGHAAVALCYLSGLHAPGSSPRLTFTTNGAKAYLITVEGEDVIRSIPVRMHEERRVALSH